MTNTQNPARDLGDEPFPARTQDRIAQPLKPGSWDYEVREYSPAPRRAHAKAEQSS